MTIKEQIKILDDKIKQIQADYDLYRQNAKISYLSSGKLDKYEYLTGEDLGYKSDSVQQARSEYSLLGQVFNKGLNVDEKHEGLLKRFKNIESKNEQQLDLIGKINLGNTKSIGFENERLKELKKLKDKIEAEEKDNKEKKYVLQEQIRLLTILASMIS